MCGNRPGRPTRKGENSMKEPREAHKQRVRREQLVSFRNIRHDVLEANTLSLEH